MAYDVKKKLAEALELTKKDPRLFFIEDVTADLGISKDSFYTWWPKGSDAYEKITDNLKKNKIRAKKQIRQKLMKSGKASELIALYKLIGSDEERKKLSQSYHDVTSDGEKIEPSGGLDLSKLDTETLRKIAEAQKNPSDK
jgi:hypothetical protein